MGNLGRFREKTYDKLIFLCVVGYLGNRNSPTHSLLFLSLTYGNGLVITREIFNYS